MYVTAEEGRYSDVSSRAKKGKRKNRRGSGVFNEVVKAEREGNIKEMGSDQEKLKITHA